MKDIFRTIAVCSCILISGWWISESIQKTPFHPLAPNPTQFPETIRLDIASIGGTAVYLVRNKAGEDVLSTTIPGTEDRLHPAVIYTGSLIPLSFDGTMTVNVGSMPVLQTKIKKADPWDQ